MLDPVRFLSNLSSGEMGYALARAARARNYQVTLISGPTALKAPREAKFVPVVSAQEMQRACREHFPKNDILIMTAAVCDFMAASKSPYKIHRLKTKRFLLKQTPDIVAGLAKRKGRRTVIGFCLETEYWLRNARLKLRRKRLDGIVANYYGKGNIPFGKGRVTAALIERNGKVTVFKKRTKNQLAHRILEWAVELKKVFRKK
jgi:phosphopantothenoylcysteine decarboxylase/phosphopantothenate--cysteine ligase